VHWKERIFSSYSEYLGTDKRYDPQEIKTHRNVTMQLSQRQSSKDNVITNIIKLTEKLKAVIRAKVENQFRVTKYRLGYLTVRYQEMIKNSAPIMPLFV
jgi:hypothetical protein